MGGGGRERKMKERDGGGAGGGGRKNPLFSQKERNARKNTLGKTE